MVPSTLDGQPRSSEVSDAELLGRFVSSRDENAFASLVVRHGPMVFGVCRRLLPHVPDAEDAFQATFLILVRKAASIGRRELLGNWLYGVALRVARRARQTAARRQTHETADRERIAEETHQPTASTDLSDAITVEVQRLPAKYRGPVVLYYLQGRTNEEIAGELRCPVGTIKTRLSRAREMLRKRLTRRGLALSTAALSTALLAEASAASLPLALIDGTVKAAAGEFVSAQVAALTKGVLRTMFATKMKTMAVLGLALVLLAGGGGTLAFHLVAKAAEAKKTDKENIQGRWKVVSAKADGKVDEPEKIFKKMEIILTANKLTCRIGDTSMDGIYKIDPKAEPKTIDLIYTLPQGGGEMPQLGIYKLKGDTLTICCGNPNKKDRPTEFESKKGSKTVLMVLKRVKK